MRARETNALDARHAPTARSRSAKSRLAVVIRIHRLAEQHDLRHSVGDDAFHLAHDIGELRLRSEPRVVGTMQYVHR